MNEWSVKPSYLVIRGQCPEACEREIINIILTNESDFDLKLIDCTEP